MKPKTAYLALCVAGTVLPYMQFLPFVREHGLDMRLFVEQLFSTRIGAFFGLDVLVSSLVLWMFVLRGRTAGRRRSISGLPSRRTSRSASRSACRSFSTCEKSRSNAGPRSRDTASRPCRPRR